MNDEFVLQISPKGGMTNVEVVEALNGIDLSTYPYDEVKILVMQRKHPTPF